VDSSGAGYYLDPANNGFSYRNDTMNWTMADGAITAYDECERYALRNSSNGLVSSPTVPASDCGNSLDDFVDNQSLQDVQPVIWYSQSRTLDPRIEDWPVIRDLRMSFDLLPFDWTAASPFETSQ
jgi:Cu2+-containing amine oxidase